jgi:hypothetical protein
MGKRRKTCTARALTVFECVHVDTHETWQASLRAALENHGHVSADQEKCIHGHVAAILHALHAAYPGKLAKLLAPARTALPAVQGLLVSYGLD